MIDPRSRRAAAVIPLVLAGLSMLGPFSIDTPFPGFPQMREEFGVGSETLQLTVSAYLFAFGLMSIFHGPISDALGRKPVMVGGVAAYGLASLGAALAPTIEVLVGFRLLQGLFAGGGVIVSRTIIRDLYAGAEAQRLMSRVAMIFGIAPAVAPIVGGLILQIGPWEWIFYFQTLMALVLVAAVQWVLPETHPPARRTRLAVRALLGSLWQVCRSGRYQRVAWAACLSQAAWFTYVGGAAIIVVDLLGRTELDFWMLFGPLVAGMTVGSWLSGRAAGRISGLALVRAGYVVMLGAAVFNVVLTSRPGPPTVALTVIGPGLMGVGQSMLFPTTQLALLDIFPRARGAAASGATFLGLTLSAAVSAVLPSYATSTRNIAIGSLVLVLASGVLWGWHFLATRATLPAAEHPEEFDPPPA